MLRESTFAFTKKDIEKQLFFLSLCHLKIVQHKTKVVFFYLTMSTEAPDAALPSLLFLPVCPYEQPVVMAFLSVGKILVQ